MKNYTFLLLLSIFFNHYVCAKSNDALVKIMQSAACRVYLPVVGMSGAYYFALRNLFPDHSKKFQGLTSVGTGLLTYSLMHSYINKQSLNSKVIVASTACMLLGAFLETYFKAQKQNDFQDNKKNDNEDQYNNGAINNNLAVINNNNGAIVNNNNAQGGKKKLDDQRKPLRCPQKNQPHQEETFAFVKQIVFEGYYCPLNETIQQQQPQQLSDKHISREMGGSFQNHYQAPEKQLNADESQKFKEKQDPLNSGQQNQNLFEGPHNISDLVDSDIYNFNQPRNKENQNQEGSNDSSQNGLKKQIDSLENSQLNKIAAQEKQKQSDENANQQEQEEIQKPNEETLKKTKNHNNIKDQEKEGQNNDARNMETQKNKNSINMGGGNLKESKLLLSKNFGQWRKMSQDSLLESYNPDKSKVAGCMKKIKQELNTGKTNQIKQDFYHSIFEEDKAEGKNYSIRSAKYGSFSSLKDSQGNLPKNPQLKKEPIIKESDMKTLNKKKIYNDIEAQEEEGQNNDARNIETKKINKLQQDKNQEERKYQNQENKNQNRIKKYMSNISLQNSIDGELLVQEKNELNKNKIEQSSVDNSLNSLGASFISEGNQHESEEEALLKMGFGKLKISEIKKKYLYLNFKAK